MDAEAVGRVIAAAVTAVGTVLAGIISALATVRAAEKRTGTTLARASKVRVTASMMLRMAAWLALGVLLIVVGTVLLAASCH
jgi:hypothetical protein